jgi:hypothetical protein
MGAPNSKEVGGGSSLLPLGFSCSSCSDCAPDEEWKVLLCPAQGHNPGVGSTVEDWKAAKSEIDRIRAEMLAARQVGELEIQDIVKSFPFLSPHYAAGSVNSKSSEAEIKYARISEEKEQTQMVAKMKIEKESLYERYHCGGISRCLSHTETNTPMLNPFQKGRH